MHFTASIPSRFLKAMHSAAHWLFDCLFRTSKRLFIVSTPERIQSAQRTIQERLNFYFPDLTPANVRNTSSLPWEAVLSLQPVLFFRKMKRWESAAKKLLPNWFYIDCDNHALDGWEWIRAAHYHRRHRTDIRLSRTRFTRRVEELKSLRLKRSYIFGTGPSLEKAAFRDWSDGYRVVSNTIVRDPDLWRHLNPHFLVAADGIYHFGHTAFARAFRKDVAARLKETRTFFIYPALFDEIVQREFRGFRHRLIPIPTGMHLKVEVDLCACFQLPDLCNVLSLMLLPLGCTLSRTVCLWGFDGRAPQDTLFWANSNKHTYPELMTELQRAHPQFFRHYVPSQNPAKYVQSVHGELLDQRLSEAEAAGFKFCMLHPSWTRTLQKRFDPQIT
jgi:hypothetical protein